MDTWSERLYLLAAFSIALLLGGKDRQQNFYQKRLKAIV